MAVHVQRGWRRLHGVLERPPDAIEPRRTWRGSTARPGSTWRLAPGPFWPASWARPLLRASPHVGLAVFGLAVFGLAFFGLAALGLTGFGLTALAALTARAGLAFGRLALLGARARRRVAGLAFCRPAPRRVRWDFATVSPSSPRAGGLSPGHRASFLAAAGQLDRCHDKCRTGPLLIGIRQAVLGPARR